MIRVLLATTFLVASAMASFGETLSTTDHTVRLPTNQNPPPYTTPAADRPAPTPQPQGTTRLRNCYMVNGAARCD
jgi:hypothetical protein